MTYDLHGQWDAENPNAQIGCDDGMCLRSHINLTETMTSLAMVTKAGVDSGKVVVGVSSYGRSFKMASAGCDGPNCKFTGGRLDSNAKKGECTDTAGYISNAEINKIIGSVSTRIKRGSSNTTTNSLGIRGSSRVNRHFVDASSNSNILVYDDTEWVAYMTPEIRSQRTNLYKGLNLGGSVNWATDLEEFTDPPEGVSSWGEYRREVKTGNDPVRRAGERHGKWTTLTCNDPYWVETPDYTPAERWAALGVSDAWSDLIDDWKRYRDTAKGNPDLRFSDYISYLVGGFQDTHCEEISATSNCWTTRPCETLRNDNKTGPPAAALILNSFVKISSVCDIELSFILLSFFFHFTDAKCI